MAFAAAAVRRKRRREEEDLTPYGKEDLNGWEFKIVRSATGAFRKPEFMAMVLRVEAQAGWELVEKFDNERLRLKRPISFRVRDVQLPAGQDPYRTQVGIGRVWLGLSIAVSIMILMSAIGGLLSLLHL